MHLIKTLILTVLTWIIHQEILSCPESFQDENAHETYNGTLNRHFFISPQSTGNFRSFFRFLKIGHGLNTYTFYSNNTIRGIFIIYVNKWKNGHDVYHQNNSGLIFMSLLNIAFIANLLKYKRSRIFLHPF